MSIPSVSYAVQTGVIAAKASRVCRQFSPTIEDESSMRNSVSNLPRNANLSSWPAWNDEGTPLLVGTGEYAGGASFVVCTAGLGMPAFEFLNGLPMFVGLVGL